MTHKKTCLGRSFKRSSPIPGPAAKSWNDDKFYENLQAKMMSKPPEPLWQPQWKKPVIEKLAWGTMSPKKYEPPLNVLAHPGYSMIPGNTFNSDWITE